MSKANFTRKFLNSLCVPDSGRALYRDATVRGLGIKVEATGRCTFFWSRKVSPTRLAWKTIGELESVTLEAARAKASEFNTQLATWKLSGRNGAQPFESPAAATLALLLDRYIEQHINAHAKNPQRAAHEIRNEIARHASDWRTRKLSELRRSDVVVLRERIKQKSGLYAANHFLQSARAIVNFAIREELWQGTNPFAAIQLFRETKRQRFLVGPELWALKKALEAKETSDGLRDYVRLALMTGARKGDLVSMRWPDVDLERATWLVPQPKNEEPYYIALTNEAVRILAARKARLKLLDSQWVFPSRSKTGHVLDFKQPFAKLLKLAGIANLRQHDLRRTLGSWQAAGGASLTVIGKSLGHKSLGATQVYAQLQLEPIRASVEAATAAMARAMRTKPVPQLLPMAAKKARRE